MMRADRASSTASSVLLLPPPSSATGGSPSTSASWWWGCEAAKMALLHGWMPAVAYTAPAITERG